MSTYADVVISPATTHSPVVSSVSQATRPLGSSPRMASSTESLIWSAILSGWPSVTLSEVKVQRDTGAPRGLIGSVGGLAGGRPDVDDGVDDGGGDRSLVAQSDGTGFGPRTEQHDGVRVVPEADARRTD